MIHTIIDYTSKAIYLLSAAVIVWGIVVAAIAFVSNEIEHKSQGVRQLRVKFGGYLLFGLELLIGADILKTIVEPTYEELAILAGIVVLRTILSVFLNREIKELDS